MKHAVDHGSDQRKRNFPKMVFVSYATADREIAEESRDHLEKLGVRAWMAPRDIRPGEDYGSAICAAINDSKVLVLILSRHANASPAVRREVERAYSKGVCIIPLRIEEFTLGKGLEYFVHTQECLNVTELPREQRLALLAGRVIARLTPAQDEEEKSATERTGISGLIAGFLRR